MGQYELVGVCICAPAIALGVTMIIITILNRQRMAKDKRNKWLRRKL